MTHVSNDVTSICTHNECRRGARRLFRTDNRSSCSYVLQEFHSDVFRITVAAYRKECSCQCS
jgi:hypothetical protein